MPRLLALCGLAAVMCGKAVPFRVQRALESAGEYFANVSYDARAEGQAILRAVAQDETPPDHPAACNWLFDRNLLDANNQFVVPMVARWVRECSARLPATEYQ